MHRSGFYRAFFEVYRHIRRRIRLVQPFSRFHKYFRERILKLYFVRSINVQCAHINVRSFVRTVYTLDAMHPIECVGASCENLFPKFDRVLHIEARNPERRIICVRRAFVHFPQNYFARIFAQTVFDKSLQRECIAMEFH